MPKLLCVASAVDFEYRYGCTPAWWQLWKALHLEGVQLLVAPYRGRPIETVWWRSAPNPAYYEGQSYSNARELRASLLGERRRRASDRTDGSLGERITQEAISHMVTPRWRRYLEEVVEDERPDAVVVFNVPMAHFSGIPAALRERFDVPVVFYDGDMPMSLPEHGGTASGFNYYEGADPGEYDLVVSNSEGGVARLLELGARRAEVVFWAVDPEIFSPQPVEKDVDVFFYGHDDRFREGWMEALIGEPSRGLPETDFAIGGYGFSSELGAARRTGDVPFNVFPRAISAARINLCITREPTASVYASSSCRPFELAACGAAIVANPYHGIERWFEEGSELLVVNDAAQAAACYRDLLADPGEAAEMGKRARARVIEEHTYRHRARRLLELIGVGAG